MSSSPAPASGGSTMFGFLLLGLLAVLVYFVGTASGQMKPAPYLPYLLPPVPAPVPPAPVVPPAPAATTPPSPAVPIAAAPATIPVYIPLPSYEDQGFIQDDEVPSAGGTIKIRRSSGAFRAEGPESIANALLVKEKIATQGSQDFTSALTRPVVVAPPQVIVQRVEIPVLLAPAPTCCANYVVLGPYRVRDCHGRCWHYSRGYWR